VAGPPSRDGSAPQAFNSRVSYSGTGSRCGRTLPQTVSNCRTKSWYRTVTIGSETERRIQLNHLVLIEVRAIRTLPGLPLVRDDNDQARGVTDDLAAHRAHHEPAETAAATPADHYQVGVTRRIDEFLGRKTVHHVHIH